MAAKAAASRADELRLVERAARDEAGLGFLQAYLTPLIESIAGKYVSKDCTQQELERVAWIPLERAIEHFLDKLDGSRFKFSTYYSWWAKASRPTWVSPTSRSKVSRRKRSSGRTRE